MSKAKPEKYNELMDYIGQVRANLESVEIKDLDLDKVSAKDVNSLYSYLYELSDQVNRLQHELEKYAGEADRELKLGLFDWLDD